MRLIPWTLQSGSDSKNLLNVLKNTYYKQLKHSVKKFPPCVNHRAVAGVYTSYSSFWTAVCYVFCRGGNPPNGGLLNIMSNKIHHWHSGRPICYMYIILFAVCGYCILWESYCCSVALSLRERFEKLFLCDVVMSFYKNLKPLRALCSVRPVGLCVYYNHKSRGAVL